MSLQKRPQLTSVTELSERGPSRRSWEDFDHSQTLILGCSGLTCIVYDRETYRPHILQSCRENITTQRLLLAGIAGESDLFISTHFVFVYRDNIYVGSEVAGICLADVIDCTIPLREAHVSSILKRVVQALIEATEKGIQYSHVKASNVFLSHHCNDLEPDLLIQLANFGPRLEPQEFEESRPNPDCQDVGHLAYHIITRLSKIPKIQGALPIPEEKMLKLGSSGYAININTGFSETFLDFLETCMSSGNLRRLIGHDFLMTYNTQHLIPLMFNAERSALRPCLLGVL
ncbi:MAG: hypothetical protein M1840_000572 [Geoglossum simile]|nr:MAG: hypothetical protein M1840_000572 [Geoglossum simile]